MLYLWLVLWLVPGLCSGLCLACVLAWLVFFPRDLEKNSGLDTGPNAHVRISSNVFHWKMRELHRTAMARSMKLHNVHKENKGKMWRFALRCCTCVHAGLSHCELALARCPCAVVLVSFVPVSNRHNHHLAEGALPSPVFCSRVARVWGTTFADAHVAWDSLTRQVDSTDPTNPGSAEAGPLGAVCSNGCAMEGRVATAMAAAP